MNEYNLKSGNYWEEVERVQNEIWASINVKGVTVIDVGVGESTQQLVKLGANVIGIDIDVKKVERFLKLNIPMIVYDFMDAPFRREIADLVVFYFTLHEVDPSIHDKILHVVKEIAPLVMVVEPSPYGCPTYEKYAEI
ncbi:MAG: hypothetical protein DRO40_13870 [Thermoprotei archaeon]|nr:MAG: hypothetical protein DRO40_13870 [Thermoprotei archaeon]